MVGAKILLILGVCVLQSTAVPETHHFVLHTDTYVMHQDIIADLEENYALIVVGENKECEKCNSTINYHDFDTGMVAFKEISTRRCYLTKSPLKFLTIGLYSSKHSYMEIRYKSRVHPNVLTQDEIVALGGPRIAAFCKEYDTREMKLTKEMTRAEARRKRNVKDDNDNDGGCQYNCGVCWVEIPEEW